jgi:hypothetical protein
LVRVGQRQQLVLVDQTQHFHLILQLAAVAVVLVLRVLLVLRVDREVVVFLTGLLVAQEQVDKVRRVDLVQIMEVHIAVVEVEVQVL